MKACLVALSLCLLPIRLFGADADFESDSSQELGQISDTKAPKCSDPIFYQRVMKAITKYFETENVSSAIGKRKKALKLANIKAFETVSAQNFSPETDFHTANALIMIKINKKVNGDDIILCRQTGEIKKPVYVIAYPYMDNYQVYVINLTQNAIDYEQVSFIYP